MPLLIDEKVKERFNSKWKLARNGCWRWTDVPSADGYGYLSIGGRKGKKIQAHRISYLLYVGSIPAGYDIDHECHNKSKRCKGGKTCLHRRCVNPAHLKASTRRSNLLAGKTVSARNALVKECPRGHLYDEKNTQRYKGHRYCRTCVNKRRRDSRASKVGI